MAQDSQNEAGEPFVDYRALVAAFTFAEHARRADEYFSGLNVSSTIARKPFASLDEVGNLCAGISATLAGLKLFAGARVLEFGAATCWFSRILALLRCEVVAVDVSGKALELGRKLIESDSLASDLHVEYVCLENEKLPFPDASFDRVLCFDTLHHVPDQETAISEFARVLKEPGIIALHEPGPHHSTGPQSQYEMRKFGVIEADVYIEKLIMCARQHGISDVEMAVYCARPVFTGLHAFEQFMADPSSGDLPRALIRQVREDFQNRRVCFMRKGDPDAPIDSRRIGGLLMEFDGAAELHSDHVSISGTIRNTGASSWLPSSSPIDSPGQAGDVNIGVHLIDPQGLQSKSYYARYLLSNVPVPPGKVVRVAFSIPYPTDLSKFCFEIDLVAEHVSWFEIWGSRVFKVEIERGKE